MITPAEIARGSGLETPMGTTTVVVLDIFGENSFELTTREHQDAVETILPHRANPTFGEGVGLGSSNRGEDRRNSHRGEDLGEAFRELRVAIADQELHAPASVAQIGTEVSAPLGRPRVRWGAR